MGDPAFKPVVVAPTFNNAGTLGDVVARVVRLGLRVVVVNDGSTDGSADVLARFSPEHVTVVAHAANRGKAAALRTGFAAAAAAGFTHAVTIDTDGQLDPEEIPALLDAARAAPTALVLGRRDDSAAGYPGRSRVGRRISNLGVRLECGLRVDDSQCGFRVYPLGLMGAITCRAGHYGFETEVITRAAWAGCAVVQVPVHCRYLPAERRVSHFRPWADSLRGVAMHFFLIGRALLPWPPHPRWPDARPARPREPLHRRFWNWINPATAWRQLKEHQVGRHQTAAGLAFGVFIANLPAYGFQSLLSLYTAKRLHMHPLPVLIGSHASTPPVGPMLIAAAVGLGHLILHGSLPAMADYDPRHLTLAQVLGILHEWLIGGVLIGLATGSATFLLANMFLRRMLEGDGAGDSADDPPAAPHPAAAAAAGE
jgi:uncharacterized protein (DUF2062 family)